MGVTVLSRESQVLQVTRSEKILIALPNGISTRIIAAGLKGDPGPQGIPGPPGPATVVGVEYFNGRQNNVTLLAEDITGALGYTPVNPAVLVIPDSPEDIGAATAAQGALAASAVQPDVLNNALANKVDKVAGYGLSAESYNSAEKNKLAGIEVGAQVNAAAVSRAEAEAGTDTSLRSWTVQRVWQAIASWWAASSMKTKLDGIATGATANSSDATLLDRTNHTGTQAASSISDLTEVTQDIVGAMMVAGTNVSLSYDDTAGTLTVNASGGGGGGAVDSVNGQTGVVVLDAGDVSAEYPLTAGSNITIDRSNPLAPVISSTASGTGTGIQPKSIAASEALSAGHYVNLFNDSGTLKARKAGGSGKYPAHGFVKAAFSAGATAAVYPLLMANDAMASLTVGTTYFISTSTAGAVQATAPNSSGVLRQELGIAISATEILHTNSIPMELI